MPFLRRHRFAFIALASLAALGLSLPWMVRAALERRLSAELQTPVAIGTLWWNPFAGEITVRGLSVGPEGGRISAERLSFEVGLYELARGEIVLERVDVDAIAGKVHLDDQYRPMLGDLQTQGGAGQALPDIGVHRFVVTGGELTVEYPLHGETAAATIQVNRLVASDLRAAAGGSEMSLTAELEGSLNGGPVKGEAQVHLAGDERQIKAEVTASGVAVNRDVLPLPAGLQAFDGKVDLHATYETIGKPAPGALQLAVTVHKPRILGGEGMELSAKEISLPKIRVDMTKADVDLGAIAVDAPALNLALTEEGMILPQGASGGTGGSGWTIRSAAVEVRRGEARIRRGETAVTLGLKSFRWGGFRSGHPTPIALQATADTGGSISIEGTLGLDPLDAEIDVQIADLTLPPLEEVAAVSPVHLAKGAVDGTLHIGYLGQRRTLEGKIRLNGVHTAPPASDRQSEVLAVHAAEVDFSVDLGESPGLDIASLKLSYPYAMVQRSPGGVFPYSLLGGDETPPDKSVEKESRRVPFKLRLRRIEVEGGKVEFVDTTLEPPFWSSLTNVTAAADEILLPAATVASFKVEGRQDELSPVTLSGTFTARGLEVRAELEDMLLESLNPYASPVLGYKFTSGWLSLSASAEPSPPLLDATTELVLRGVEVLQTGSDAIQSESGVPLPIALRLIKNTSGAIELSLPFAVDTRTRTIELGSLVWQAVRSAVVGALTSPLRILGSLFGTKGAPQAFAIDPIPFAAGSGSLDRAGAGRVAQIARILQTHQGLVLVLMPQVTAADVAQVGSDGAAKLAEKRNAAVRDALAAAGDKALVAPDRLIMVPWQPSKGAEATGAPGVYVELQEAG